MTNMKLAPADRTRRAHSEPRCRPPARHPALNGGNHSITKILREHSWHPCWPPSPARILNQKNALRGIPLDSKGAETALNGENVDRLIASRRADLVFTDPPYN